MARHWRLAGCRSGAAKARDEGGSCPQGDRDDRRAAALDEERNNVKRDRARNNPRRDSFACFNHHCALHHLNRSLARGIEQICQTACAGFDQYICVFTKPFQAGREKGRQNT